MLLVIKSPFNMLTLPVSAIKLPTTAAPFTSIVLTPVTTSTSIIVSSTETPAFVDEMATLPLVEIKLKSDPSAPTCVID